ncbi:hypothetical protein QQS21_000045 [Conoideocrella luteorostrata]|uniref:Hydrophobin n=1 Tax=Conoideocrella luteorostrata TaxID=1105319 RepID=A0AAJ0G303_9HYPO|nr:hypothetical protein QQS21_000045 [Conoideocrella luteorostrata]
MLFKAVILAFAAVAAAVPTNWGDSNGDDGQSVGDVCGNGNTVHCCNDESAKKLTSGGLIPLTGDLQNLLGQCNDITGSVLGGAAAVNPACSQQAVCCGQTEQHGLVNIGCFPINV